MRWPARTPPPGRASYRVESASVDRIGTTRRRRRILVAALRTPFRHDDTARSVARNDGLARILFPVHAVGGNGHVRGPGAGRGRRAAAVVVRVIAAAILDHLIDRDLNLVVIAGTRPEDRLILHVGPSP